MTKKLLIVENHAEFRKAVRKYLETQKANFDIFEAPSAETAIDEVIRLKPDIVLMDIRLPQMNGMEAAKRIKALHPSIVIIVLTMFATDDLAKQRSTVAAFIDKSRLYEDLMPTIHKYT